jgi:hypothetical protein
MCHVLSGLLHGQTSLPNEDFAFFCVAMAQGKPLRFVTILSVHCPLVFAFCAFKLRITISLALIFVPLGCAWEYTTTIFYRRSAHFCALAAVIFEYLQLCHFSSALYMTISGTRCVTPHATLVL